MLFITRLTLLFLFLISWSVNLQVYAQQAEPRWYETSAEGDTRVHLYFFWSKKCPHCLQALPFVQQLERDNEWIELQSLELTEHPQNVQQYIHMASLLGQQASSVPAFIYCGNMLVGYEYDSTTGMQLKKSLQACYEFAQQHPHENRIYPDPALSPLLVELPVVGVLDTRKQSMLLLTLIIAGLDAFNPCAFFVLLFLLSMMAHAHSRSRMLLIGGIFVSFSGLIYFLFMTAWLNLFLYLGELRIITLIAGLLVMFMALVNIKDYFWFHRGISLSIPQSARPRLFERMRGLLVMDRVSTVVLATVVLAIAANSYELLCSAGFPMVFTRILTLRELAGTDYYLYLVLYNLVYVLPLFTIVLLFSLGLGSRKLSEKEGRVLKLLSGLMMLMLGVLLVVAPWLLDNIFVALMLLLAAISLTWIISAFFNNDKPAPQDFSC